MSPYTTQNKLISIVAFVALSFSIVSYFAYSHLVEQQKQAYYAQQDESIANGGIVFAGPDCFPDPHPNILLAIIGLSALSFATGMFVRYPILHFVSATLAFGMFPYWYLNTQEVISLTETNITGLDSYLYRASSYDLIVLVLLTVVLLWRLLYMSGIVTNKLPRSDP